MSYFVAITTYQLPNHMVIQVIRALQIYKIKHITIKIIDITSMPTIKFLTLLFFISINGIMLNIAMNTNIPNKTSTACIIDTPFF